MSYVCVELELGCSVREVFLPLVWLGVRKRFEVDREMFRVCLRILIDV